MYRILRDRQIMRSDFGCCRGSSRYEHNVTAMPLRHAVIACLFIIFCVNMIAGVAVIVSLLALLAGLIRLSPTNENCNPGTSCT